MIYYYNFKKANFLNLYNIIKDIYIILSFNKKIYMNNIYL